MARRPRPKLAVTFPPTGSLRALRIRNARATRDAGRKKFARRTVALGLGQLPHLPCPRYANPGI
eukprot:6844991-Lingulodinium_polyedra.AAC.1